MRFRNKEYTKSAKEYLQQMKRFDTCINQKLKELDDLRHMSICINGIDYAKERVQTSPGQDAPFTRVIERIDKLSRDIDQEIDEYVDEKHAVIQTIQELDCDMHTEILYKRYVEFKSFEQISVEIGYAYRHTLRKHGSALREYAKKYGFER